MSSFIILDEFGGENSKQLRLNLEEIESYVDENVYISIHLKSGRIVRTVASLQKLDKMFSVLGYTFKDLHEEVKGCEVG